MPNFTPYTTDFTGPAVQMRQVVKKFKNAAGEFIVLKGIDLALQKSEFVSIIGKSGSGKSTLLNMLTGIDRPTSGDVVVGGVHLHRMSESQRALWRGRTVGIVFQFFQLLPTLSLLENIMLPMDYCQVYQPEERPRRALELLSLVGLEAQAHKLPAAVSAGQQQSAAIARALSTDPPILVADEPTGNLDTRSAEVVIELFDSLAAQGKTIIMVTHDPSLTNRTQRNIIISDGELVDETIGRAFPLLNHRQMLSLTRQVERRLYQPGETILQQQQQVEALFIIAQGEVEISLDLPPCPAQVVARLDKNNFFGEIELLSGGGSLAGVRAAPHNPVEVLSLPRQTFLDLLQQSPLTEQAICAIVQYRLAEHQQSKAGCP